jgi:phosphoribosylanthranilate isomerase
MTWIKICGITNLEDALVAVEAGADALGFVFYEKSPRYITAENAGRIIEGLPDELDKVAIVVEDFTHEMELPRNLTAVQWTHMAIPENFAAFVSAGAPRFKSFLAFPAGALDERSVNHLSKAFERLAARSGDAKLVPIFDALFLDSGNMANPGGTGKPFDWKKAVPIADQMRKGPFKLVVAGGLNPSNLSEAIAVLHPWGVDVSSGVEARPGKKDPEKVRAFIRAVREADKANSN